MRVSAAGGILVTAGVPDELQGCLVRPWRSTGMIARGFADWSTGLEAVSAVAP